MPRPTHSGFGSLYLLGAVSVGSIFAGLPSSSVAEERRSATSGLSNLVVEELPLTSSDGDAVMYSEQEVPWPESQTVQHETACSCGDSSKHCAGVCTDPGHPAKPVRTLPGDIDRGDCPPKRYCMDDCVRAGFPHCVAPWARCSVNGKYSAWFVGGGAPFLKGRPRKRNEGTWGLDYSGFFGHANVWLNYTCGRNQGGEGAYETEGGPELLHRLHHQ